MKRNDKETRLQAELFLIKDAFNIHTENIMIAIPGEILVDNSLLER
jgi:hypothetical protein